VCEGAAVKHSCNDEIGSVDINTSTPITSLPCSPVKLICSFSLSRVFLAPTQKYGVVHDRGERIMHCAPTRPFVVLLLKKEGLREEERKRLHIFASPRCRGYSPTSGLINAPPAQCVAVNGNGLRAGIICKNFAFFPHKLNISLHQKHQAQLNHSVSWFLFQ